MHFDLERLLVAYFPPMVLSQLRGLGQEATAIGYRVYLIGGNIRDMLLQRPFDQDVDVVVDANPAIPLAQRLHKLWGGQLQVFPQYGTASLSLDEIQIDLATARTETYAHPGANPVVQMADLNADLARRDLSINALAMALNPQQWGELVDHYGGLEDLHNKVLRALHSDKFLEDPVRSWRACRFESTLGHFQLEPQSAQWLHQAMQTGLFDGFVTVRIKKELLSILGLPDPRSVLRRLAQLEVLRCLAPTLKLTPAKEQGLAHWIEYRDQFPVAAGSWLVPLLLLGLKPPQFIPLQLSRQEQQVLDDWFYLQQTWPKVVTACPSELFAWGSDRRSPALLALLASLTDPDQREQLLHYWIHIHPLRPRLSGKILKEWQVPGPAIGQILQQVLNARLDGLLQTEAEEYEWARQLAENLRKQTSL